MKNIAVGQEVFLGNGKLGIYSGDGKVLLEDGTIHKLQYWSTCYTIGDKVLYGVDAYEILSFPTEPNGMVKAKLRDTEDEYSLDSKFIDKKIPAVGDRISITLSYQREFNVGEVYYSYRKNGNLYQVLVLSEEKDCWFDLMKNRFKFVY